MSSYKRKNLPQPEGFKERLRDKMFEHGFTCYDLSKKTGIDDESIRKYVNGSMNPSITMLMKMCVILHCSADYLIFGKREPSEGV